MADEIADHHERIAWDSQVKAEEQAAEGHGDTARYYSRHAANHQAAADQRRGTRN